MKLSRLSWWNLIHLASTRDEIVGRKGSSDNEARCARVQGTAREQCEGKGGMQIESMRRCWKRRRREGRGKVLLRRTSRFDDINLMPDCRFELWKGTSQYRQS